MTPSPLRFCRNVIRWNRYFGGGVILVDNPLYQSVRLFSRGCHNIDRYVFAAKLAVMESDAAVCGGKQGVVLTKADIGARIEFGAALTHEDVAANNFLAAELLHTKALRL